MKNTGARNHYAKQPSAVANYAHGRSPGL